MRQRTVGALFIILLAFALLAGCSSTGSGDSAGKIRVTVTTGMIADVVRNVGRDHVAVTSLMGPGVDPHLYKASEGDIIKLSQAEIIFYNGLHLEGRMGEIFVRLAETRPVVAISERLDHATLLDDGHGNVDPHIWFDVRYWMSATEVVRDHLAEMDPANRADYQANAASYLTELKALHDYARSQLATIPENQRVLVTAHDAFSYFGRAYDVEVVGLQGISTDAEYGLADVQHLVNLLTQRKIKAVFVESTLSPRSIEAVVEGARAKGHTVNIGGQLFSDAMGAAGTPEGTYIGMVRHNVDTIVGALK